MEREMLAYWQQQIDYHKERIARLNASNGGIPWGQPALKLHHMLLGQSERKLKEARSILEAIEAFTAITNVA